MKFGKSLQLNLNISLMKSIRTAKMDQMSGEEYIAHKYNIARKKSMKHI